MNLCVSNLPIIKKNGRKWKNWNSSTLLLFLCCVCISLYLLASKQIFKRFIAVKFALSNPQLHLNVKNALFQSIEDETISKHKKIFQFYCIYCSSFSVIWIHFIFAFAFIRHHLFGRATEKMMRNLPFWVRHKIQSNLAVKKKKQLDRLDREVIIDRFCVAQINFQLLTPIGSGFLLPLPPCIEQNLTTNK